MSDRYRTNQDDDAKSGRRSVGDYGSAQDQVVLALAKYGPMAHWALVAHVASLGFSNPAVCLAVCELVQARRIRLSDGTVLLNAPTPRLLLRMNRWWVFILLILLWTLALIMGCESRAHGAEGVTWAKHQPETTMVGRWVLAEMTAYCPCDSCTDGDRITADGTSTEAEPYNLAADRSLPMGALIYVPVGSGVLDRVRADARWFAVDDRGGALDTEAGERKVLRLDLRVKEHWWARKFGRRMVPVFILSGEVR